MILPRRILRGSSFVLVAALLVGLPDVAPARQARQAGGARASGPIVIQPPCPSVRGLGVADRPWPALVTARRFLRAQRRPDPSGRPLWRLADRWLRYRVAPDGPRQLREAFPSVPPGTDRWRVRVAPPRWLDARFHRLGPFLNVRLKLLAAGVQVFSCPRSVVRRLVQASWWVRVVVPDCACDPDRFLDVLVVERGRRYRVFGVD